MSTFFTRRGSAHPLSAAALLCVGLAVALMPAAIVAQETPEMTAVFGDATDIVLFQVHAAAAGDGALAVLTDPDPAVHVFTEGEIREWGAAGGGPGELASPVDIELTDGSVFVLDVGRPRFVRYDTGGSFLASRPTEPLRANRMWVRGPDTVLATFLPLSDARAAVRLRDDRIDTLFAFQSRGRTIRLEASGAPSFSVKPPYLAQVEWTVLSDGGMVRFDPVTDRLEWLDRDGRLEGTTALPWEGLPVTGGDREWWVDATIPESFMGQRVFEPLRSVARETLEFPERLPLVLAALEDAGGGVWLRRTTPVHGERWALVDRSGHVSGDVVLPPGRELLATDRRSLFVLARDDLGVERIEVYRRPAWAAPPEP